MNKTSILTAVFFLFLAIPLLSQIPGFNYQAVLRDAQGEVMSEASVKLHFSLLDADGTVLFKEVHDLSTNELGQITTMIGTGTVESGEFATITGIPDLQLLIEAELPGEPDIVDFGTAPVGTVPYAIYGADEDADPDNELQRMAVEGDSLTLTGTPGLTLNNLNYWQKTDSSFFLSLGDSDNQRAGEGAIYQLGPSNFRILSDLARINGYLCPWTNVSGLTDRLIFAGLLESAGINLSTQAQFAYLGLQPNMYNASILDGGQAFGVNRMGQGFQTIRTGQNTSIYSDYMEKDGELIMTSNDGYDDGLIFCEKLLEAFAWGAIGTTDDDNTRSSSNHFGGTSSTGNHLGLTTLSGALPGVDLDNGYQVVFNGQNFGTVSTINGESAGTSTTHGANGQNNTLAGTFAGTPNHGVYMVFGEDGTTPAAYMRSTETVSEVAANVLTMLAEAPGRSSQVATFSAPMGGEAAAYDRGTAQLVNGEAVVTCPEHFQWVADEASMTVTITPLSAESQGIAVIDKSAGGFTVKELHGGQGNYAFDYMVMCKRKGHLDFEVLREKPEVVRTSASTRNIPKGKISSIRELYRK